MLCCDYKPIKCSQLSHVFTIWAGNGLDGYNCLGESHWTLLNTQNAKTFHCFTARMMPCLYSLYIITLIAAISVWMSTSPSCFPTLELTQVLVDCLRDKQKMILQWFLLWQTSLEKFCNFCRIVWLKLKVFSCLLCKESTKIIIIFTDFLRFMFTILITEVTSLYISYFFWILDYLPLCFPLSSLEHIIFAVEIHDPILNNTN